MAVKINMNSEKKVATRDSYGNTLVELGKEHPELVVLDADLASATKTEIFNSTGKTANTKNFT